MPPLQHHSATVLRFGWPSLIAAQLCAGPPDGDGIACAIVPCEDSAHVLLADRQLSNRGPSLTNCAEFAIHWVMRANRWDAAFARHATWVELDSLGHFDRIEPSFDRADGLPSLRWTPIAAAGSAARTLQAYLAAYGTAGAQALSALQLAGLIPHLGSTIASRAARMPALPES